MSLKTLLITYVVGGLTLPPLLIIAILYLFFTFAPKFDEDSQEDDDLTDFATKEYKSLSLTELEEKGSSGVKAYKAGWITVTREYHIYSPADKEKSQDQKDGSKSAYTALYRLVKNTKKDGKEGKDSNGKESDGPSSPSSSNTSVAKTVQKKKNRYFAVLRHGNLFLYKSEEQKDVQHVIVLSNNIVTIWPRDLRDGELFTKKTAICLLKRKAKKQVDQPPKSSAASLSEKESEATYDILENGHIPPGGMGFFIYCDTNYEKEDWYFALINATKRDNFEPTGTELDQIEPSIYANALHFKTADILSLIQTLHSSEGQLQTRWLNAAVGRIFLALQSTDFFERVVETKLLKKLAKINRPGFLEEFQVKKIDIGNAAPFISFPKLETLNPDGSMRVSFKFSYSGKLSLQVATKANISLGAAFKTREVGLLLAVTLNKLEGPLVISVKPPPSSRIWWTFEKMPSMDLTIEPVVSQRQITYGMVTKAIENKFRDAIKESLVEPYWDDISFFDTTDEFYRGGIWDIKKRPTTDTHQADDEVKAEGLGSGEDSTLSEEEIAHTDEHVEETLNSENADTTGNNTTLHSEQASLRSRGPKPKGSFNNISNISKRKSDASIATTEDQFLADGSYVSREPNRSQDTASDADLSAGTSRSSTMQLLSEETAAGKKAISTGLKKIGNWYEKNKSSSNKSKKDKTYTPPEMISRRRAPSNTSDKERSPGKTATTEQPESHKSAPQPHAFPAEYMYGMDTQRPDSETSTKSVPPAKVPQMKSPYSAADNKLLPIDSPTSPDSNFSENSLRTPTSPKAAPLTRKKPPVDVTSSAVSPDSGSTSSSQGTANAKTSIPIEGALGAPISAPEVPLRANVVPPALPPRAVPVEDTTTDVASQVKKVPPPLPLRDISPPDSPALATAGSGVDKTEVSTPAIGEVSSSETPFPLMVGEQDEIKDVDELQADLEVLKKHAEELNELDKLT
ncbi:Testis-expressed sequence 2 protein [Cyberlindnera fabianii]|uniref:Testis-expressed sequence 2 protein n=1 Tax=Cyberlindnera fabianii TaxID=36022 RepID=A0A1V2L4S9_CYBFA|nr:Testis-expressed sequence 2 protein [Cyberlindnera fabianii]